MRQTAVTKLNQEAYSFMPDHPFLVTQTHTAVTLALPAYQSDQSFDITSRSFDEPEVLQENSIQEDTSLPIPDPNNLLTLILRYIIFLISYNVHR
jgi:hypothetical protein